MSHLKELQELATSLGLRHETLQGLTDIPTVPADCKILFLPSVTDKLKQWLLDVATILIYTPRHEHFGIVPLEAMLNEVPVLAANEGGPVETVLDGETGWLRDVTDRDAWTGVLQRVVGLNESEPEELVKMGKAGRSRVKAIFSKQEMAVRLDDILDKLNTSTRKPLVDTLLLTVVLLTIFAILLSLFLTRTLFLFLENDSERPS